MQLYISSFDLISAEGADSFAESTVLPVESDGEVLLPFAFRPANATLVTLAFQGIGQTQLKQWHEPFLTQCAPAALWDGAAARTQPRLLNLLYLEGWSFKMLKSLFLRTTRRSMHPPLVSMSAIGFEANQKAADVRIARFGEGV